MSAHKRLSSQISQFEFIVDYWIAQKDFFAPSNIPVVLSESFDLTAVAIKRFISYVLICTGRKRTGNLRRCYPEVHKLRRR